MLQYKLNITLTNLSDWLDKFCLCVFPKRPDYVKESENCSEVTLCRQCVWSEAKGGKEGRKGAREGLNWGEMNKTYCGWGTNSECKIRELKSGKAKTYNWLDIKALLSINLKTQKNPGLEPRIENIHRWKSWEIWIKSMVWWTVL